MNNKVVIAVSVAVLLLAGVSFFYFSQNKSVDETQNSLGGILKSNGGDSKENTVTHLQEIMTSGKDQKCTFSFEDEDGTSTKGTTYISKGAIRTDFSTTNSDGSEENGGMILNNNSMSTWDNKSGQGVTMDISQSETNTETAEDTNNKKQEIDKLEDYMNPDEDVEYNCSNWRADTKIFTLPSNIKFLDFNENSIIPSVMQKDPENMEEIDTSGVQIDCSFCDSLPQEAVDSCRVNMGC